MRLLLSICSIALISFSAHAVFPGIIQYQGKLTSPLGIGANDTLPMTFRLFNSEAGGTALWTEIHTGTNEVPVVKGLFDVNLGGIIPFDVPFNVPYWLEIEVDGNILTPRVKLATSPYAFRAAVADSFTSGMAPWTQDTMIAHWDSLRGVPAGFADGDQIIETRDTMIAYWDSLRNIPLDFADGIDDIIGIQDTMVAHWDSIRGMPTSFNDGDWNVSGSNMYSSVSGNVGIGTTSPTAKLEVVLDNCDTLIDIETFFDGFEDMTISPFTGSWTIVSDAFEGSYCAKSNTISHGHDTPLSITRTTSAGNITFARKVSSESGCDFLRFFIDGVQQASWSGNLSWEEFSYPVTSGSHFFQWIYSKDGSVNTGSDCGWIDAVQFPESSYVVDCGSDMGFLSDGGGQKPSGILINGNVGIGTTSPLTTLHVAGSSTSYTGERGSLMITGGGENYRLVLGYNSVNNYGWIQSVNSGVAGMPLALNPLWGNVGIGTTNPAKKLDVLGEIQATGTGNNYFAGNVKIGSPPDSRFDEQFVVAGGINIDNSNLNTGTYQKTLRFGGSVISGEAIGSNRSGSDPNAFGLDFYTSYANRMCVTNSGNVGIGTTSPATKLDVVGDVRATGKIRPDEYTNNGVAYCYGQVAADGTLTHGTSNITSVVWEAGSSRYKIDVTGGFFYTRNSWIVTPYSSSTPVFATVFDAGVSLYVKIWNLSGTAVQNRFSFVVYDSNF